MDSIVATVKYCQIFKIGKVMNFEIYLALGID